MHKKLNRRGMRRNKLCITNATIKKRKRIKQKTKLRRRKQKSVTDMLTFTYESN